MSIRIFVEDEAVQTYEFLVLRALGHPTSRNRAIVRASRIQPEELTTMEGLLSLTRAAGESGYERVLFILDEEGPRSPERPPKLESFRRAFQLLCGHLATLKENQPLRRVKIARIICQSCLESWLAADPQAIIDSIRGRHGIDFRPAPQRTDHLRPEQAVDRIAHLLRETGRQLGRRNLRTISSGLVKSLGSDIAKHVAPDRARRYNRSLDYFFQMIQGDRNGCDDPFPDGPIEP